MSISSVETYKNESGQIAVLVSPGYGAGWSTWNCPEIAYDKRVVEWFINLSDDDKRMLSGVGITTDNILANTKNLFSSWGYTRMFFGGLYRCYIEWVEPGEAFRIDEYDGSEKLVTFDMSEFTILH